MIPWAMEHTTKPEQLMFTEFGPRSDWTAPELPDWSSVSGQPIAVDVETQDLGLQEQKIEDNKFIWGAGWPVKMGRIVGVSAAVEGHPPVYLPFGHPEENGPYTKEQVAAWLDYYIKRASCFIAHNAAYDLGWLRTDMGIKVDIPVIDTMVLSALLNENRKSHSLDYVCRDYGYEGKDEDLLIRSAGFFGLGKTQKDIKANLWCLPARYVGPYAEADATQALAVSKNMLQDIADQNMVELSEIENELIKMTVEMRLKGIRVDTTYAEQLNNDWIKKQDEIIDQLYKMTGLRINPTDPKDLLKLVEYEQVSLNSVPRTDKKRDYSFQNHWMKGLELDSFDQVVRWRNLQHSRNNYVEGIALRYAVNSRVYPEINTVKRDEGGTVSGRLSVNNPALQQISARNPEVGPAVRRCFLPEEGAEWGIFDYSQQEPRLAVHFAALLKIRGSNEAVEYYHNDPAADFHQMMSELTGKARKIAKDIFLGMCYGMGNDKLAWELGVSVEECIRIRDEFDAEVPWVSDLSKKAMERAGAAGYIKTLLNRRCRFDFFEPYGKEAGRRPLPFEDAKRTWPKKQLRRAYLYKAMNRLIQGSAADQTKKSMYCLWKEGELPMLQMHDDLNFSIFEQRQTKKIEDIMLYSTELKVPSKVDVEIGPSWGEAE